MKWSKWGVAALMLVVIVSMVSFKPMQSLVCSQEIIGYQEVNATVLVAYQVWHGLESHECAFQPLKKPYDSRDRNVIRRHIEEANERGIDGFVVDWYGPKDDVAGKPGEERGFQDLATEILFEEAELQGFLVALMYDDQTVKYAVPHDCENYLNRVKKDLQYAKEKYFGSPVYLKINDCPALFIFPDDNVKECLYNKWGEIKEHLGVPVTLLDRDPNPQDDPDYDAHFEGFYTWVTPTKGLWDPNGHEWGEEYLKWFYKVMQGVYADKVAVGGVWPGFDDSLAFWSENRFMTRSGTETHDQTLKLALDNNVEYILVGTWNDFEEGTDIEYGVHMHVDMEKQDPEVLLRSSPVKVVWSSDIPSADLEIWMSNDLINYEFVDKEPFSCGDYLSLTPGNLYELKLWTQIPPYSKWVKIRRIDPVPGVDPQVFETKTIRVISPDNGDRWQASSSQTITWNCSGTFENVKIQYSLNNGCNWTPIIASTENDGSFSWTVPDIISNQCLIWVSDTDNVPLGKSSMFSIVPIPSITINSPNGHERWFKGSVQEIKWNSNGGFDKVTIYNSRDNGTTWKVIFKNTPNDGSFFWRVRGKASDQCLIRVAASDSDLDPIPSDTSDAVFSILHPVSPSLEVIAPNGGEQLMMGSFFTIKWDAFKSRKPVKIEYSINSGDTWELIIDGTQNNGRYDWMVPAEPSQNCLIRISQLESQLVDVSDMVFSIISS